MNTNDINTTDSVLIQVSVHETVEDRKQETGNEDARRNARSRHAALAPPSSQPSFAFTVISPQRLLYSTLVTLAGS